MSARAPDVVVRRSFVSWLLHALFAPGRPQIARLAQDRVQLHAGSRSETVLLHDVVSVSEEPGVLWRGLSIEVRGGRRLRISGLPDGDATRFARAVAAAREETARGVLASRADALAAAAILLREMRAPPRYVRLSAFGAWLELVEQCLVDLPARPPSAPDMQDAVRILEDVQDAVRDPQSFRTAANQAYVRDELNRMRTFLDQVESKPLTSDQRRAVVVDEDRNLVVAAAGSGKTSVIVAKVAHLVQLFAVGDDWQSIYRFAGADVSIMREFGEYFGTTERTDLGETFRCADRVCDVATRFVIQNPSQLRKDVRAVRRAPSTRVHVGFAAENGGDAVVREALASIAQSSAESERTSVMVLGRYRHSEPGNLAQLRREFVRLDISFMTIHASKGQEADWVVIVDLQAGRRGFPSAAQDDPLLDLVLARAEPFQHAEERRLFYVALTRARHGAYLVATGGRPSAFVTELLKGGYDVTTFGTPPRDAPDCPSCVTAKLAIRDGPYGRFWGCENYPLCEFKDETCRRCNAGLMQRAAGTMQVRCSACGLEERVCPACGAGRLVHRTGPYGPFLGCSAYPRCRHKDRAAATGEAGTGGGAP